jgi:hypothetical protein
MRIVAGSASYTLPESIAVNDGDTLFRVAIESGVLLEPHRPQSGALNASGILFGASHLNAEELERTLISKLQGELRLYRHDDSVVYSRVVLKSVSVDTYRGRFDGKATGVSLNFESLDGYRYGAEVLVSEGVDGSDVSTAINNPGAVPAYAVIEFEADATSSVIGDIVLCNGRYAAISETISVPSGQSLIITDKSASLAGVDITRKLAIASLVSPIILLPGNNAVSIYGLNKHGTVTISMTPRWPG